MDEPGYSLRASERLDRAAHQAMWWSVAIGVVTTVGLAALAGWLLLTDALIYGILAVLAAPDTVEAPDDGRYLVALAAGAIVNLAGAPALAWLGCRRVTPSWPPVLTGVVAALVATVAGACTLLLALGIDPIGFVLAL